MPLSTSPVLPSEVFLASNPSLLRAIFLCLPGVSAFDLLLFAFREEEPFPDAP